MRDLASLFLSEGITLEHFHSSGNTPVEMEQLKIKQREFEMRSAHAFT